MRKNIFLAVAGFAACAIVAATYEIYKVAKGINEVANMPDDFPIYTGTEHEE